MNSGREKGEMRGKARAIGTIPMILLCTTKRCACDEESSKADGLGSADFMGLMEGMESVGVDWTRSAGVIFSLCVSTTLKCRFDNKLCLLATAWHSSSVGTNSKQEWGHKNLVSQSPLGPQLTDNQMIGREAREHIAILIMNEMAHERANELGHLKGAARLSRILIVRLCLRVQVE
ncbi:hypothetical protein L3X38_011618 [Prunus dulcis]|uniref:Uncharacterized protein n=1 Tax=Prunus dulcis TaxID=3755 RepID=A0AAD4WKI4_PRUDU|nr:hypothetical protein L3X38_011618 [Prunus dulcis]